MVASLSDPPRVGPTSLPRSEGGGARHGGATRARGRRMRDRRARVSGPSDAGMEGGVASDKKRMRRAGCLESEPDGRPRQRGGGGGHKTREQRREEEEATTIAEEERRGEESQSSRSSLEREREGICSERKRVSLILAE